jgi:hypothetical protein
MGLAGAVGLISDHPSEHTLRDVVLLQMCRNGQHGHYREQPLLDRIRRPRLVCLEAAA